MNRVFHTLYLHMLTTTLKLIVFDGKRFVLSAAPKCEPDVTELGWEEYDHLLDRYGRFV